MTASAMPRSADDALREGVVTVDVVSDVVCPWCYVGKARLEKAIETSGLHVAVLWRPFQLDPKIPPAGLDRQTYMADKFKDQARLNAVHERLTEMGRAVGIDFRFNTIKRAPNTLDAHRLIRWATTEGRQNEVVDALFRGYFTEGRDIGDRKVLVAIAETCGLDAELVHRLLSSGADTQDVQEEMATAVRLGVSGVPFFILAGRYAVSGAQEPEVLAGALRKAAQAEPQPAEA